jgi:hypothetical protein
MEPSAYCFARLHLEFIITEPGRWEVMIENDVQLHDVSRIGMSSG